MCHYFNYSYKEATQEISFQSLIMLNASIPDIDIEEEEKQEAASDLDDVNNFAKLVTGGK